MAGSPSLNGTILDADPFLWINSKKLFCYIGLPRRRIGHDRLGSLKLREYPGDIVRLSCSKCGRAGQYRKQSLIDRYGADIRLPDLREQIAKCSRHGQWHDGY